MLGRAIIEDLTVEAFLAIDFGPDRKVELVDGRISMMTGGTRAHSRTAVNILAFLRSRLRGSGCFAANSDMGLQIGDRTVRYPDVAVYCGRGSLPDEDRKRVLSDPTVLVEIASPSTQVVDATVKLEEYRGIASVDTIVFIDPELEMTRVIQRDGTRWRDDLHAIARDIPLPALGIVIPHAEIFARD